MNADSSSSIPFPDVHQAEFDTEELGRLIEDIASCATVSEVLVKCSPTDPIPAAQNYSLAECRDLLLKRQVRAVQIRYHYDESDWWDTLMPLGSTAYRLVRVCHRFDAKAP